MRVWGFAGATTFNCLTSRDIRRHTVTSGHAQRCCLRFRGAATALTRSCPALPPWNALQGSC